MFRLMFCALAFCLALSLAGCSNEENSPINTVNETASREGASGEVIASEGGPGETVSSTATPPQNTPLIVGVMPSMDYLPLAIAEREGYFTDLGVSVTIQLFFSANERDAAFQSNSIDGTVIDYTGAIIQHASGTDLCLTSRCDAPFYLLASPGSGITAVAALRGHSVAISQNTVIDYLVDQALTQANVPASGITRVEINRIPIRYEMLMNNKIDATGLPNPFALLAEKSGAAILTSNKDMNLSITGIMFTGTAVETKAHQIRQMYRAYAKGVTYLKEHPLSDYQDILIERFGYTPGILGDTTLSAGNATISAEGNAPLSRPHATVPAYDAPTLPDKASINEVTAWLKKRGLIKDTYDPVASGLLDGQFLPQ